MELRAVEMEGDGLRSTYSVISSNCMSTPKAWRAASASSSPAASMGPGMLDGWMGGEAGLTCEDDELAPVSVIESVLALARENMRDGESNVLGRLARTPHHPSALVFRLTPRAMGANLWVGPMGSGRIPSLAWGL